jgi:AraC-like DNA-binding protein
LEFISLVKPPGVIIKSYIPTGMLKEFVDTIHFLGGEQIGNGVAFPRANQVIIINLGSNFNSSDLYTHRAAEHEVNAAVWMNGKHDTHFMLGNKGVTKMYAIGIKLGMMPYFADLPAYATNEQAVDAINWTSAEIFNLREQLLSCNDTHRGFLLIEQFLINMLKDRDFSSFEKIKWLSEAIKKLSVNQISQTLGASRKRLRSEAQFYFGSSIKTVQGIIRFNKTLSQIAHHPGQTLSSLHEYYDQAHFINDFKANTGITPLQYKRLCLQFPFIKHTPNFLALKKETFLQFIAD